MRQQDLIVGSDYAYERPGIYQRVRVMAVGNIRRSVNLADGTTSSKIFERVVEVRPVDDEGVVDQGEWFGLREPAANLTRARYLVETWESAQARIDGQKRRKAEAKADREAKSAEAERAHAEENALREQLRAKVEAFRKRFVAVGYDVASISHWNDIQELRLRSITADQMNAILAALGPEDVPQCLIINLDIRGDQIEPVLAALESK